MKSTLLTSLALWIIIAGCSPSAVEPTSPAVGTVYGPNITSFQNSILPIFTSHGCTGGHGGRSGLTVRSVQSLLIGGDHGPSIVPGDADTSLLVKKLSANPPFGSRMPLGGPYLTDSTVQLIALWINQGGEHN